MAMGGLPCKVVVVRALAVMLAKLGEDLPRQAMWWLVVHRLKRINIRLKGIEQLPVALFSLLNYRLHIDKSC